MARFGSVRANNSSSPALSLQASLVSTWGFLTQQSGPHTHSSLSQSPTTAPTAAVQPRFIVDAQDLPSPPPTDHAAFETLQGLQSKPPTSASTSYISTAPGQPHRSLFGGRDDDQIQNDISRSRPHDSRSYRRRNIDRPLRSPKTVDADPSSTHHAEAPYSDDDAGHEGDDEDSQTWTVQGNTSDEQLLDEDVVVTRYEFRPGPRAKPLGAGGTWIDHDRSGDYDPSVEGRRFLPRPIKRRRRDVHDDEGEGVNDETNSEAKHPKNYHLARQRGFQLIMVLQLASAQGKELLRRIPENNPQGYEQYWNFLDDEHIEEIDERSTEDQVRSSYRLRSRLAPTRHRSDHGTINGLNDEGDFSHITIGHPAARGCKACYSLGQVCAMLEPGGTYPCYLCIEDDCDCELVVEPTKKRACEGCKKRRIRCSYLESHDHCAPCLGCQILGGRCVAGPAVDRTRTRIGYDDKPATVYPKEPNFTRIVPRPKVGKIAEEKMPAHQSPDPDHLTCIECRRLGRRCTGLKADSTTTCSHCRFLGVKCRLPSTVARNSTRKKPRVESGSHDPSVRLNPGHQVLDADAAEHFKQLAVATQDDKPPRAIHRRSQTRSDRSSSLESRASRPPPGRLGVIFTRLIHPIYFNATASCHWCKDPLYSLFGVGINDRVKVRFWPDGKGCTELARQTPMGSLDPSKMCPDCTMDRVLILTCDDHDLRPIPRKTTEDVSLPTALQALADSPLGHKRRDAERQFCSICPSVATHKCCAKTDDETAMDTRESGCGLCFCDICAVLFEELFGRDLQRMVKQMNEEDKESYPNGLRADYDFFASDSYLVKQVLTD